MVKRYFVDDGGHDEHEAGQWVKVEDYLALESKLDRIREILQNCTEADEAWVASGVILAMLESK